MVRTRQDDVFEEIVEIDFERLRYRGLLENTYLWITQPPGWLHEKESQERRTWLIRQLTKCEDHGILKKLDASKIHINNYKGLFNYIRRQIGGYGHQKYFNSLTGQRTVKLTTPIEKSPSISSLSSLSDNERESTTMKISENAIDKKSTTKTAKEVNYSENVDIDIDSLNKEIQEKCTIEVEVNEVTTFREDIEIDKLSLKQSEENDESVHTQTIQNNSMSSGKNSEEFFSANNSNDEIGRENKNFDKISKIVKRVGYYSDRKNVLTMKKYVDIFDFSCDMFDLVDENIKLKIFKSLMMSHPASDALELNSNKNKSYEEIKELLITAIDGTSKKHWLSWISNMVSMKMLNYKSLSEYFFEFARIRNLIGNNMKDEVVAKLFVDGLPHDFRVQIRDKEVKSLFQCYEMATEISEKLNHPKVPLSSKSIKSKFKREVKIGKIQMRSNTQQASRSLWWRNPVPSKNSKQPGPRKDKKQAVNGAMKKMEENEWREVKSKNLSERYELKMRKNPDRLKLNNRFDTLSSIEPKPEAGVDTVNSNKQCRSMNIQKNSSKPPPIKSSMSRPIETNEAQEIENLEVKLTSFENNSCVYFNGKLGSNFKRTDIKWQAQVDSGAGASVIDLTTAKTLGLEVDPNAKIRVTLADGSYSNKVIGRAKNNQCYFKIPGTSEKYYFRPVIMDGQFTPLLGMDIIKSAGGGHFEKKNGQMTFRFNCLESTTYFYKIRAAEAVTLQPNESKWIKTEVPDLKMCENGDRIMIKPLQRQKKYFETPCALHDPVRSKILLVNRSQGTVNIEKTEVIANAEVISQTMLEKPAATSELWKNFRKLIRSKISHLNGEVKSEAERILLKHWRAFAEGSGSEIGEAKNVSFRLNPKDEKINVPVQKRRGYNPAVWEHISKEIEKLEELGVIEDCIDPDIAPANLVLAKRKGKVRMCVDYVPLNKELPSHHHPLPTSGEMIDNLQNSDKDSVYTKFDASKCFHNFLIDERDRKLTAFFGPKSVKQYRKLPFGLKTAPSLVQQYMSKLMTAVNAKLTKDATAAMFLDDGLIHSKGANNGLRDLDIVLQEFEDRNIRLKLDKLEILKKSIVFMGVKCTATPNGAIISTTEDSLEAIRKLRAPKTVKELRSMLGAFGWLSDFLPALNLKLHPFFELLKKTQTRKNMKKRTKPVKFSDHWTKDHDLYFEEVKKIMPQCLSVPNYKEAFIVEVDSSELGHAACIYQVINGKKRMISFASKKLPAAAKNYANDHRETAGIVFALEKFQRYIQLAPKETIVHTDNRVASFIKSAKSPKLQRYKCWLDQFNLKLVHKAGSKMYFSDAFSRLLKNCGEETPGTSDELLEEFEIAAAILESNQEVNPGEQEVNSGEPRMIKESELKDYLGLMQTHYSRKHPSTQALEVITGKPRSKCKIITDSCIQCLKNDRVKVIKQQLGTIKILPRKNYLWSLDFVNMGQSIYLSVLDAATNRMFVEKVPDHQLKHVVSRLKKLFAYCGKPEEIVSDLEFLKNPVQNFLIENGIKIRPMARHSPWLNPVERGHGSIKPIARKNNCSLEQACEIYNNTPYLDLPKGLNAKKWCPLTLYAENDKQGITLLREVREKQSIARRTRFQQKRGNACETMTRKFIVGDVCRFMVDNKVRFGLVKIVNGKLYNVEDLQYQKIFRLHAQEMVKVNLPLEVLKYLL